MIKQSRVLTNKNISKRSILINKIYNKSSENTILGDMFIKCIDKQIVDITNNNIIKDKTKSFTNSNNLNTYEYIIFNGKNTYISIKENHTFNFGLDDFTIDWWEYKLSLPIPNLYKINTTQFSFYKNSINKKQPVSVKNSDHKSIYLSSDGINYDIADDRYMGMITENKWSHWAIIRCNNDFYIFKNGNIKNNWNSDLPINNSNGFLTIGSGPKGNNFFGYMFNFRIIKDVALWTDVFKPTYDELFY